MNDLGRQLQFYGANPADVITFAGEVQPAHVRYLDLSRAPATQRPDAVLEESPGRAQVYILDARYRMVTAGDIATHLRLLALRGEPAYLAVLRVGRLDAYEVALEARADSQRLVLGVESSAADAATALPRLLLAPDPPAAQPGRIHAEIHRLMSAAIDALQGARGPQLAHTMSREDSVSLVGRAVFTRFLVDRGLLGDDEVQDIAQPGVPPEDLFGSAEAAAATCAWLDRTFNGDFLPVDFAVTSAELNRRIDANGWRMLGNILHKSPGGQLALDAGDGQLDWPQLDFSRIPVGVLSQVYEQQAHHWDPGASRRESVFYTPGPIAAYMIGQVFGSLDAQYADQPDGLRPCDARVLDPAVGGGVFLVSAFREIIKRRWLVDGARPNTAAIREVLYSQLVGLDRQTTALRLTALSLYLAAVEMDPAPQPVARLRFSEPLIGQVLIHVGGDDAAGRAGSLGSNVGSAHRRRYDVVIGNPPWTATRRDRSVMAEVRQTLQSVVAEAVGEDAGTSFSLPDDAPDLGFLWRTAEWCKPGGRFALVTHARLLFKQSGPGCAARDLVFRALRITGILNGTALRLSPVWPNVSAPFAVLFGVNERPAPDGTFHFASPLWEPSLNQNGCFRIDAEAALPVSVRTVQERTWMLKALFRGTRADVGVLAKVLSKGRPLSDYWQSLNLAYGEGFQVALGSGRCDARHMLNLPMLSGQNIPAQPILVASRLPEFRHEEVHRPRAPEIYAAPLAIVHDTMAAANGRPRVYVADARVAYSESFFGFSACGHPEGKALVRYLRFLLDGPLFHWFALLTSSKYGIERDVALLEDVERFPIIAFENITPELRGALRTAAESGADLTANLGERRRWLSELYDLSDHDWTVIEDTVRVSSPEARTQKKAFEGPSGREVAAFCRELQAGLRPALGPDVLVWPVQRAPYEPWVIVLATRNGTAAEQPAPLAALPDLLARADSYGASQVRVYLANGRWAVAILRQRRYWTQTRARLLALDISTDPTCGVAYV